ncbi:MAG: rhodanese-like domain-containing protein [Thermotogae bacterium]|nr:rhodanese-like domain-containing protein [Thermotogota bacterium]
MMMLLLSWSWITPEWLYNYIKEGKGKAIIVDVRTPQEHAMGYIPGTHILIPHNQLAQRIAELKADPEKDTIIVYCRSGNRSTYAARILEAKGFKHVLNLKGGFRAWRAMGLPSERPKPEGKKNPNIQ